MAKLAFHKHDSAPSFDKVSESPRTGGVYLVPIIAASAVKVDKATTAKSNQSTCSYHSYCSVSLSQHLLLTPRKRLRCSQEKPRGLCTPIAAAEDDVTTPRNAKREEEYCLGQHMEAERGSLASRLSVTSAKGQAASNPDITKKEAKARQQATWNSAAFWLLGLLNNSGRPESFWAAA